MASSSSHHAKRAKTSSKAENDEPYEWAWQLYDESVLPIPFDQGPAGSCAIIAGSLACVAAYKISDHILLRPAFQQLVNEIKSVYPNDVIKEDEYGVPSAFTSTTLKFIKEHGIGMADELPYQAKETDDRLPPNSVRLKIRNYEIYSDRELPHHKGNFHFVRDIGGKVIEELIYEQPIVGEFIMDKSMAEPESWANEIYSNRNYDRKSAAGHSILITGFGHGVCRQNPFYWCQNTKGRDYGAYGGYVKIARDAFHSFYNVVDPYLELPKI